MKKISLFAFVMWSSGLVGCQPRTIVVGPETIPQLTAVGEGEVYATPDVATVRLGLEQRSATAEEAMRVSNQRMRKIISAVKSHGVSEEDIQTSDLSVYFERRSEPRPLALSVASEEMEKEGRNPNPQPTRAAAQGNYVVRNTVIVRVRDLGQLGETIGAAMQAGANQLHGLEMSLSHPEKLQREARELAVKDAREKAERMAKQAGVPLGGVLEVQEMSGGVNPRPMMAARMMAESSAVPVERGQLHIAEQVRIVFKLDE